MPAYKPETKAANLTLQIKTSDQNFQTCNEQLRNARLQAGLTQSELAMISGYSDRLIRKAENGGRIRWQTLVDIVDSLRERGSDVQVDNVIANTLVMAKAFVDSYDFHGKEMLAYCGASLSDDFTFEFADPLSALPKSGTYRGVGGFQGWLDQYFSVASHPENQHFAPDFFLNGNQVVVSCAETLQFKGRVFPPIWIYMRFWFKDGKIVRVRDDYDTATASWIFEELAAWPHVEETAVLAFASPENSPSDVPIYEEVRTRTD